MVYLRARYYMPNDGRFLTRDTWMGDYNRPLSLNRWMYGYGNPVKYTDPSGNKPGWPECVNTTPLNRINIEYADKNVNLDKSNWLNTYTAAGIAVQCWADLWPVKPWEADQSGQGPAQISNFQVSAPYGETVKLIGGGENGFGIRCYLRIGLSKNPPCTYCFTEDELEKMVPEVREKYVLEPIHDQKDITWATIYMKRKIMAVTKACRGKCTSTDLFVAASLGQGSGFTPQNMSEVSNPNPDDVDKLYRIPLDERGVSIHWLRYFVDRRDPHATSAELNRFAIAVQGLVAKGWALPPERINWQYIASIRYWTIQVRHPR